MPYFLADIRQVLVTKLPDKGDDGLRARLGLFHGGEVAGVGDCDRLAPGHDAPKTRFDIWQEGFRGRAAYGQHRTGDSRAVPPHVDGNRFENPGLQFRIASQHGRLVVLFEQSALQIRLHERF